MKTIGLLGGMSWESTELYYRYINQYTRERLGGLHSAPIAMISVDFAEIEAQQSRNDWDASAKTLATAARQAEAAGAELLLICTNTMHKVADEVQAAVSIPLVHLADATAQQIHGDGVVNVGLLGTRYTMEQDFYTGRLKAHGLNVLIPSEDERASVHDIIFSELCLGVISDESRQRYMQVIASLTLAGAEAIILGCTEIALLVKPEHAPVPLYDTTRIHAAQAVKLALE
ncbi:MAG: aspartate/glutamate racemase family protein [Gammaproteobacteria bacterium]